MTTETIDIRVARPGARAWATLVTSEAKMVLRDTAGMIVPIALPLLIMVMSASGAAAETVDGRITGLEAYVLPIVLAIVLGSIGMINMPGFLAYYRRTGILKRLAVTPASPLMVLTAQVVVSALQAVLGITVALAVAMMAFGAQLPANLGLFVLVLAAGMVAMYSVGLVVASLAPTPNAAVAIGLMAFFAFGALGGMFGGTSALPDTLASIGAHLPFGATSEALHAVWTEAAIGSESVISLGVTTVLGVGVAAATFRWT